MAAQISYTRFIASHGIPPRGVGLWMFENKAGEVSFQLTGTFTEAKKAALAWAKANPIPILFVCP